MSEDYDGSPHNEGLNSSISGISDTANLPKHLKGVGGNELRRQGYQKSRHKDSASLLALISSMSWQNLYISFANQQIDDLKNGATGPRGIHSALVLNTFLDSLVTLSGAGFKDQELFDIAVRQAESLMRAIKMSTYEITEMTSQMRQFQQDVYEAA